MGKLAAPVRADKEMMFTNRQLVALMWPLLLEQLLEHAGTSFLKGFEVGLRADSNSALAFTL